MRSKLILILFFIISSILGFLFSYLYLGNIPLQQEYNKQLENCNLEQFRVFPKCELTDDEIKNVIKEYKIPTKDVMELSQKDLLEKYKVDLDKYLVNRIKPLEIKYNFTSQFYSRIYKKLDDIVWYINTMPEKVNIIDINQGHKPLTDNEALISYQYAKQNNVKVSDVLMIDSKEFKVSGLYTQASESLIYNSKFSTSMTSKNNAGVIVTNKAYDLFKNDDEEILFLGIFNDKKSNEEIDKIVLNMMDDPDVKFVASSTKLSSFNSLLSNFSMSLSLMAAGVILFFVTIIFMTLMLINNWFKSLQKSYGVLLGMGYSSKSLTVAFFVVNIPVFLGLVVGSVFGYLMAQGFMQSYCNVFNIIKTDIDFVTILGVIIFVNIVLFIFNLFIVMKCKVLLNKNIMNLILDRASEGANKIIQKSKTIFDKASVDTKIRAAYILKRISRFVAIMFVSIFAIILSTFSIAIFNLSSKPIEQYNNELNYDSVAHYSYKINNFEYDNLSETFIQDSLYVLDYLGTKINTYYNILSLNTNCKSLKIVDENNNSLLPIPKYSIVVSAKFADMYDVKVNSQLTFRASNGKIMRFNISGINSVAYDTNFYVDRDCSKLIFDAVSLTTFNGEFLNNGKKPFSDDGTVISKDQQIDDVKGLLSGSMSIIPILIVLTILLVTGISCLIAYLNVKENKKDIVIFSLLGYKDRKIFNLIVNIYSTAVLSGSIIGYFLVEPVLLALQDMVNTTTDVLITLKVSLLISILIVVVVFILYNIIINLMMSSIKRINLSEVLYE